MIPRYLIDFDTRDLKQETTDVCVIGSGIAGLYTALQIAETDDVQVTIVCKKELMESNTYYAQGGVAAVISERDSPLLHKQDTIVAGDGLCSIEAVDALVNEGPKAVDDLIRYGVRFDRENGKLALAKEGAHSQRRILRALGDATGAEMIRALSDKVRMKPNIRVLEHHFAIDLVTEANECVGALIQDQYESMFFLRANATILATGGAGQLYRSTTNPEAATGDGVAMAYRAGAHIQDVEFIQFHPTALCCSGAPRFLISEAVRGEGAVLRNIDGERFMGAYHSRLELAPRDIVARSIALEMKKTNSSFVYLDITHRPEKFVKRRFPKIYRECLRYGLDMTTDWIPVAPAAHYMMGGVRANVWGETSLARLFACGEVACVGVHGANRLASNSLSEAMVFGKRIAKKVRGLAPLTKDKRDLSFSMMRRSRSSQGNATEKRASLQQLMSRSVGLFREAKQLSESLQIIESRLSAMSSYRARTTEEFEYFNLLTCAFLVTKAALAREESRGGHFRLDFPKRDDATWRKRIVQRIQEGITEERCNDDKFGDFATSSRSLD